MKGSALSFILGVLCIAGGLKLGLIGEHQLSLNNAYTTYGVCLWTAGGGLIFTAVFLPLVRRMTFSLSLALSGLVVIALPYAFHGLRLDAQGPVIFSPWLLLYPALGFVFATVAVGARRAVTSDR
ncbi:hypothetical protein QDW14_10225 [Corynebacterium bovis]|uniref:hypothetical protein n=1 Tax=Corynebacterium bovis TaxID=36808 RepID=UPI0024472C82|nr:hypothetical protein [Corynebacterium bovis]MDH2456838.1 hypothetical protein [Corynebacterium bovis]